MRYDVNRFNDIYIIAKQVKVNNTVWFGYIKSFILLRFHVESHGIFSRLSGLKSAQNDGKASDYHHSDYGFYMAMDEMTGRFRSRNSEM